MNLHLTKGWISVARITALIAAAALTAMILLMSRASMMIWLKLASAMAALLFGWFALSGHTTKCRSVIAWMLGVGILFGTIGLIIGFSKPGLFGWEGNLAPLVGVFWTGPIAFICGALLGCWLAGFGCLATHSMSRTQSRNRKDHATTRRRGER